MTEKNEDVEVVDMDEVSKSPEVLEETDTDEIEDDLDDDDDEVEEDEKDED
jgi:hypothetical protein